MIKLNKRQHKKFLRNLGWIINNKIKLGNKLYIVVDLDAEGDD